VTVTPLSSTRADNSTPRCISLGRFRGGTHNRITLPCRIGSGSSELTRARGRHRKVDPATHSSHRAGFVQGASTLKARSRTWLRHSKRRSPGTIGSSRFRSTAARSASAASANGPRSELTRARCRFRDELPALRRPSESFGPARSHETERAPPGSRRSRCRTRVRSTRLAHRSSGSDPAPREKRGRRSSRRRSNSAASRFDLMRTNSMVPIRSLRLEVQDTGPDFAACRGSMFATRGTAIHPVEHRGWLRRMLPWPGTAAPPPPASPGRAKPISG
jgi:hypothetical protein